MQATQKVNLFPARSRLDRNIEITQLLEKHPQFKYASLWMNLAITTARESSAQRRNVGCVIVTKHMGLYTGYNGTLKGTDNCCEKDDVTKPGVIHAEANALNKMAHEGVSVKDSIVFITLSPCLSCAERLIGSGVKVVVYLEEYRDLSGVEFLRTNGIKCLSWDSIKFKKEE